MSSRFPSISDFIFSFYRPYVVTTKKRSSCRTNDVERDFGHSLESPHPKGLDTQLRGNQMHNDPYPRYRVWVNNLQVSDWMLSMKIHRGSDRRKRQTGATRRHSISTVSMQTINKKRRHLSTPKSQTAQLETKQWGLGCVHS